MTLAFFRTPFDFSAQNVYWTLALGVLAMAGLKHFEKPDALPAGKDSCVRQAARLRRFCLYGLQRHRRAHHLCAVPDPWRPQAAVHRGSVLFAWELTAPLAFVLVWFYNGQRGRCTPAMQKVFYWFYGAPERAGCGDESDLVTERPLSRNKFRGGGLLVSENGKSPVISKNHRAFSWRSRRDLNPRAVV